MDDEIMARYDQVPREIMDRARTDMYIHATIRQWVDSDQSVECLLVRLVLLLSEQCAYSRQVAVDAIQRYPVQLHKRWP